MFKESVYNIEVCKDDRQRTLLFNTKRGSLAWFDAQVLTTFHGKNIISEKNILSEILEMGFVVDEKRDETYEYLYARKCLSFDSQPKRLSYVIAPTMDCNYNCDYCFESNKSNIFCNKETINNIISFIIDQINNNEQIENLHITWFGGEPLMQFDTIAYISKEIICYCKERSIKYTANIITNGYLLNQTKINMLRNININDIQITVDGLAETYQLAKGCKANCFEKVMDNIKNLKNIIRTTIRINVSKRNLNEIKELISYIIEYINDSVKIHLAPLHAYNNEVYKIVLNNKDFQDFKKSIEDWMIENNYKKNIMISLPSIHLTVCDAMRGASFVIDPEGFLYKCNHHIGHKEKSVGNIATGYINNQIAYDFVNNALPKKCLKCDILPICAGGCISNRLENGINVDCLIKRMEIKQQIITYLKCKNNILN